MKQIGGSALQLPRQRAGQETRQQHATPQVGHSSVPLLAGVGV